MCGASQEKGKRDVWRGSSCHGTNGSRSLTADTRGVPGGSVGGCSVGSRLVQLTARSLPPPATCEQLQLCSVSGLSLPYSVPGTPQLLVARG